MPEIYAKRQRLKVYNLQELSKNFRRNAKKQAKLKMQELFPRFQGKTFPEIYNEPLSDIEFEKLTDLRFDRFGNLLDMKKINKEYELVGAEITILPGDDD